MKYVHPDYKTNEVIVYIDDLIVNGNVESFSDLTLIQKGKLSGLLLKCEPLTEILNFISQTDSDEKFRDAVVRCLVDRDVHDQLDVLSGLHKSAINYYEPTIESILNERLEHYATF